MSCFGDVLLNACYRMFTFANFCGCYGYFCYCLLYDDMFLVIILAELRRCAAFAFLEDSVEVRDVVEAASVADLYYCHGRVCQQTGSMAEAHIDDILGYALACAQLEEA